MVDFLAHALLLGKAEVHALRNLTLKSTGFVGIYRDVGILLAFSAIMIAGCIALFRRQI